MVTALHKRTLLFTIEALRAFTVRCEWAHISSLLSEKLVCSPWRQSRRRTRGDSSFEWNRLLVKPVRETLGCNHHKLIYTSNQKTWIPWKNPGNRECKIHSHNYFSSVSKLRKSCFPVIPEWSMREQYNSLSQSYKEVSSTKIETRRSHARSWLTNEASTEHETALQRT